MSVLARSREQLRFPKPEKPLGPFQVDPANKFASDLAFFIIADHGAVYDVVSGLEFVLQSGSLPGVTAAGDGIACDGTVGAIANGPAGFNPLLTDSGDTTGGHTLMFVGSINASTSQHFVCGVADTVNQRMSGFLANYTSSFSNSSGRMLMDYGNNSTDNVVSIASAADGLPHVYIGTRAPSTQAKIYLDGALPTQQTTGSSTSVSLNLSSARFVLADDNGFGDVQTHKTFLAFAGFNRVLDALEILEISLDPYSLLCTQEGELPVLFLGGAPPPSGVAFRRTRSALGTRTNSRQVA